MKGLVSPEMANEEDTCINRMYKKLNPRPIPICSPIPPFTFREETDAPIRVRMKAAKAIAKRL